jgi:hypothetical protein
MNLVWVSTSDHALLECHAISAFVAEILPHSTALTPNTSDAALLLKQSQRRGDAHRDVSALALDTIEDIRCVSRGLKCSRPTDRPFLFKGRHVAHGPEAPYYVCRTLTITTSDLRADKVEYDGFAWRNANMEILCRALVQAQDPVKLSDDHDGDGNSDNSDIPVVVDVLCGATPNDQQGGGSMDGTCYTATQTTTHKPTAFAPIIS